MQVLRLPALSDNYIHVLHDRLSNAVAVGLGRSVQRELVDTTRIRAALLTGLIRGCKFRAAMS